MKKEKMVVTPWEVKGEIDYDKLIKDFGLSLIDSKLSKKLEKYVGDNLFLRRKIFFAHRDLEFILKEYEKGNKFYLYNGRGPSGHTHIGHLISFLFAKSLQDAFYSCSKPYKTCSFTPGAQRLSEHQKKCE